jgi:hypothetical protein
MYYEVSFIFVSLVRLNHNYTETGSVQAIGIIPKHYKAHFILKMVQLASTHHGGTMPYFSKSLF